MSDPFTTLPGAAPEGDVGEPSIPSSQIAAEAAASAVRGSPSDEVATRTLQSETSLMVQEAGRAAEDTAPPVYATPDAQDVPHSFGAEAYAQLAALGVDLPVAPDQVDPAFSQNYAVMAQKMLDTATVANDRAVAAQLSKSQLQDFTESLSTPIGQERMLLSMALSNPEGFQTHMQKVERVQNDPDYAEAQRMQLEATATFEAAQRMQNAITSTQRQSKGQQVESRTERLATQMGVDVALAKEIVASKILQNEAQTGTRDITLTEVDDAVQKLAAATGASPRVMTPGAQQAIQHAPTAPSTHAGTPTQQPAQVQQAAQAPAGSQQTPNHDAMDALRNAVRNSVAHKASQGL